jgi:crossover junction endodeoxyribonuclease RusA
MSTDPCTWTVPLPYDKPPLNSNQRMHHQKRGRITKELRQAAGWSARSAGAPALLRCRVELHYIPADNRRRDADNPTPTLKAACDGLVDAGVTPDDVPAYMDKRMPVIHPAQKSCENRLYLVITDLSGEDR